MKRRKETSSTVKMTGTTTARTVRSRVKVISWPATAPVSLGNFSLLILCLLNLVPQVPAPVPRCSPFIIINKLAESSNILSDSNPYFPVPPCEYGGPGAALAAGDFESVFVLAHPERVPLHNFYEFVWLLKTGLPRLGRLMSGEQKYVMDQNILNEGYQHHTPYVRTRQIGFKTHRRPEIINNKKLFRKVVGKNIQTLRTRGQDTFDPHEIGVRRRNERQPQSFYRPGFLRPGFSRPAFPFGAHARGNPAAGPSYRNRLISQNLGTGDGYGSRLAPNHGLSAIDGTKSVRNFETGFKPVPPFRRVVRNRRPAGTQVVPPPIVGKRIAQGTKN